MTTTVDTPSGTRPSRVVPVLRLHLTNRWTTIGTPLVVLALIWAANWIVWLLIVRSVGADDRADAMEGTQFSGAIFYIFVYMMVVAVQAITRTFPFALGFSVTRRDFFLGTALLFAVLSAFYAVVITALSLIEEATGGWGLGGHLFTAVWYGTGSPIERFVQILLLFLFFFFVGAAVAIVYLRWRANGMIVFWVAVGVLGLGLAALATFTNSWPAVYEWFIATGAFGVTAWSLVVTALAALVGYVVLRRATPTA
ncbi:ABC transporter permease [Subtercola sp. Z020]|uniref:ABC transporter permease n=1 Tax=Subtercola sp. Z020 TaxID=2080582 RepID=UPI000CE8FC46|nr:ABC transporter permease [Subtercola sp. Z020]PPF81164.1 ABC transporter permease [Subtercola sp. Z020]